ncbi:hypothetical protein [Leucothrix arctica]|uniref:Uncharacterized protein n=1 Tax=Leucothrix arctica TaxID=1481894 RepID=A0A317C596_9GAMM|nr:hypothetical protein [Leucothrix arctica]PWQ93768.1 hypothetical protein DKT75_19350 [Leucothrix arctica]
MKLRLPHLVLLIALPSAVYAGSHGSFTKELRFVDASSVERVVLKQPMSYDLIWSPNAGRFNAVKVIKGKPLKMDKSQEASQTPEINYRALAI